MISARGDELTDLFGNVVVKVRVFGTTMVDHAFPILRKKSVAVSKIEVNYEQKSLMNHSLWVSSFVPGSREETPQADATILKPVSNCTACGTMS